MRIHLTCSQCEMPIVRWRSHLYTNNFCDKACRRKFLEGKPFAGKRRTLPPSPIEFDEDGVTARVVIFGRDGAVRARALIDAVDSEWVGRHRWSLQDSVKGPVRRNEVVDGCIKRVFLHREILGVAPGDNIEVDHINRDKLDNRRSNLRKATPAQNCQNTPSRRGSSSIYRGVSWHKKSKKWTAQISVNHQRTHLGMFESEVEAANAALEARQRMMPFSYD